MLKFLKKIINNKIKSFFVNQNAPVLERVKKSIKNTINKLEKEKMHNFGHKNKNKIFFVINRSLDGPGLFSHLTFVLNYIEYAKKKKYIPIVDMENFPIVYNEKEKIHNSFNSWEYYFEKINKYKLSEVYKSKNVIFSKKFLKENMYFNISENKGFLKLKKIIKIKKNHKNLAASFVKKNFKNKDKILGVHLRGSTYKVATKHPFPIPKEMMLNIVQQLIKKYKITKIFLVTEERKYLDYFKKKIKNKLIYFNSYRQDKIDLFQTYPRPQHRYKLGREILLETLILSHCDKLVYVNSNVIDAALYFSKKKQKKFEIFLGNNSSNKFIARRLWYIKNFLPSIFGGFDNEVRIKDLNFK